MLYNAVAVVVSCAVFAFTGAAVLAEAPTTRTSSTYALFATGLGGLWRSPDGFKTRTNVLPGTYVNYVRFTEDGGAIAIGGAVWRSKDAGATWAKVYTPPSGGALTRLAFDAQGKVGMATGFFPSQNGSALASVTVSTTDGGYSWSEDATPSSDLATVALAPAGAAGFTRAALDLNQHSVMFSTTTDLGKSWKNLPAFDATNLTLQNGFDVDIFSADAAGTRLIMTGWSQDGVVPRSHGGGSALNSGAIFSSADGGTTWVKTLPPPDVKVTQNSTFGTTLYEVACDGATPSGHGSGGGCADGNVFAVGGSFFDTDSCGYLLRSSDAGKSWKVVLETFESNLRDLALSPTKRGHMCVAGTRVQAQTSVVQCTTDAGATWTTRPPFPFTAGAGSGWATVSLAMQ